MFDSALNPIAGAQRIQLVGPPSPERDQLASTLETAGFRVDALAQAAEARGRLARLKPCLVLLDLRPSVGSRHGGTALEDFANYQNLPACQELLEAAKICLSRRR